MIGMEDWRDIPGWEGFYMVSSLGRIKSILRKVVHKNGFIQTIPERILSKYTAKNGYKYVDLHKPGIRKNSQVHRLVLLAFLGPRSRKIDTLHSDGNKLNNNLKNLRYGTRQDNVNDTKRHGNIPSGDRHWNTKIPDREISNIINSPKSNLELSKIYNVSWACIQDIRLGIRECHTIVW